jgi:hypothetical protein
MREGEHLILLGHPRSGSTSLYRILQAHPALNILDEPFNEDFVSWDDANKNYREFVTDVESLDVQLAEIFRRHNGIKVLCYQLPQELEVHLLRRRDVRIVFLRRMNVLQAVVSNFIARQTQLWKRSDATKPLEDYYRHLAPIEIEDIEVDLSLLRDYMDQLESVVDALPHDRVLKLTYEGLYLVDHAARLAQIDGIWRALGLSGLDPAVYEADLKPELVKMNTVRMYSYVPNANEIDAAFGCDETGWLRENAAAGE